MAKTALILAEGFEEIEALTAVDLLRRAEIGCKMLSLTGEEQVTGSHGITVTADGGFPGEDLSDYDGIILPGGLRGTAKLRESTALADLLRAFAGAGKLTAAICAAPTVLAAAGLLQGRRAVCYPGMEEQLTGAQVERVPAVRDGNVITGRGAGASVDFALAIVRYFCGEAEADALAKKIVYNR